MALVRRIAIRVRDLPGQPDPDAEPVSQVPVLKLFGADPDEPTEPKLAADYDGFNLHAAPGHERGDAGL